MGCCNSTPDEHDNGDNVPRASQAHVIPGLASPQAYAGHGMYRAGARNPLRPNQHIRAPSPLAHSPRYVSSRPPPWTRSHLARERDVYFETRVQGNRQAWDALAEVARLIRDDKLDEAQSILDAASLTCPTGRVGRGKSRGRDTQGQRARGGIYDERGYLYEVPQWCLTDPLDLVDEETPVEKDLDGGVSSDGTRDDSEEDGEYPPGAEGQSRHLSREEKGKGRARDIGDDIRVRARLSNTLKDVEIIMGSKQPARIAAQRLRETLGVGRVRLIYLGKELDENKTLEAQGWSPAHIMNAFIFEGDVKEN